MSEVTDRRGLLADAAITTLAREGMRGLTHRAVDRTAGLPEGSASYYFRTRQALLQAAVQRLADLDDAEFAARPSPGTAEPADLAALADAVAGIMEHWLGPGRDRMLARYELALEANRRPELREVFVAAGRRSRALAAAMLTVAGAPDPGLRAPLLVACMDGLIFDHLAGAGALALSRAELAAALRTLLEAFVRG